MNYTEQEIKLLDLFAGMAMQGQILANAENTKTFIAADAYYFAAAMLEERKKYTPDLSHPYDDK